MPRTIYHKYSFQQPPEIVWDYLTKPELLAEWLMQNDIKPVVGHKFNFKTKPKINLGFDGTVYCEILEVIPLKKLRYSWKGGLSEKPLLDSVVTWTLVATEEGTDLMLEHSGFKGISNVLVYFIMNNGWIKIGKRFAQRLSLATK